MLAAPVAEMVMVLDVDPTLTVTVPVLFGLPERRLKYISPEVLEVPAKVTFVILAGEIMLIFSLFESPEE